MDDKHQKGLLITTVILVMTAFGILLIGGAWALQ